MDLGLKGKVALVGGASRGLGYATAKALLQEGCQVAMVSRLKEPIEDAAEHLSKETGGTADGFAADLSEPRSVEILIREVLRSFDRIDILVHNTGGPPVGRIESLKVEDYEAALRNNFLSAVRLASLVLPGMRERKWGRIVTITSFTVKQPAPAFVLSNAPRAAVTSWVKTLSAEVAADGVLVNNVSPGSIHTERIEELAKTRAKMNGTTPEKEMEKMRGEIPVGRLGKPEELAALVAFLCSERASYLTGNTILCDGGMYKGLF